jgi:divalent metal cation (Fe/Co/Zn/Cd) transporter
MTSSTREALYKRAQVLALVTIGYNLLEGLFSVVFGYEDGTFTLFGFGVDSFVEVISGIGIWHMTRRMRNHPNKDIDRFERQALRITGGSFYLLALGLAVTGVGTAVNGHSPSTTFWGAIVGAVSIATMWILIRLKMQVGKGLQSSAILADAACTKACLYLSIVLLAASIAYEVTGIGLVDSLGSIAIAWFAFREGRESFEKAAGKTCSCCECG